MISGYLWFALPFRTHLMFTSVLNIHNKTHYSKMAHKRALNIMWSAWMCVCSLQCSRTFASVCLSYLHVHCIFVPDCCDWVKHGGNFIRCRRSLIDYTHTHTQRRTHYEKKKTCCPFLSWEHPVSMTFKSFHVTFLLSISPALPFYPPSFLPSSLLLSISCLSLPSITPPLQVSILSVGSMIACVSNNVILPHW